MNSLSDALTQFDVHFVNEEQISDINIIVVNGIIKRNAKNVLRLDGVYYDKARQRINFGISRCMRTVDGVVFQSEWAKTFVTRMTGVTPRKSVVIYNGIDQSKFNNVEIDKRGFDKVFIACSHWRPNKRPRSIIDAFLHIKNSDMKLGLFFVGRYVPHITDPSVIYFQEVQHQDLFSLYKSSDYMCHICHLDVCPNSVIEGLSAGLPVLCNNIGGTPELVKDSGIILPLDQPFDFQFVNSMETVAEADVESVAKGMEDMMKREWSINRPEFDISLVAKQYYDFFLKVLSS